MCMHFHKINFIAAKDYENINIFTTEISRYYGTRYNDIYKHENTATLRSLEDCIECSSEPQLNTSHLCILLTPWNGNKVSRYCTPHSSHTYLHSARIGVVTATKGSSLK